MPSFPKETSQCVWVLEFIDPDGYQYIDRVFATNSAAMNYINENKLHSRSYCLSQQKVFT